MQTLLVIDDEVSICKAFERAFTSETVSVLTAKTGAEGEQLFLDAKPDVVVIDLSLPDTSGLEQFKRLREIDSRVPFIFITGHGTVQSAIEATKLGALRLPVQTARTRRDPNATRQSLQSQPHGTCATRAR